MVFKAIDAWGIALILPLLFGAVFVGCESPIPRVDPESPPFKGRGSAELADLGLGRSTYILKCAGCHPLIPPAQGDAAYWKKQVEEMEERSHITAVDRKLILNYLELVCLPGPGESPGR